MVTAPRSPALVGRDSELALLRRAMATARQGSGGLLLVTGEAGVGKSRLVSEATAHAGSLRLDLLLGHAVEGGGPYRPLAEALAGPLGDAPLIGVTGGASEELRPFMPALARLGPGWQADEPVPGVDPVVVLGEGVLRLLTLGGAGAVLVLEDLHWADHDTLALLEYLVPRLARLPLLVVGTARSDELHPALLLRLTARRDVPKVPLSRLADGDAARLAAACAGGTSLPAAVLEPLVRAAEGLPFLVEELLVGVTDATSVAASALEVPATLTELVRRRMVGLTPQSRKVVEAAAVLGRSVEWSLLGPMTGLPEEQVSAGLRAAVAAYLLEPDGDRFGWRHSLMREAVLAQLLAPERATLAGRAADLLAAQDPQLAGAEAAMLADLYASAGHAAKAAEVLVALARRAVGAGAPHTAEELLDRADALGAGPAAAAERVRTLTVTGRAAEALDAAPTALLGAAGEERFRLLCNLARAAVDAGRWEAAEAFLDRTGRPEDPQVVAVAADAAYGAGRVGDAALLATSAAESALRAGQAEVACEALQVVARCARHSDARTAAAAFRQAADVAEEHSLVPWRIRALLGLGTVELQQGRTGTLEEVRRLALDAGMLAQVADTDLLLADARTSILGPVAALENAERSAALAGEVRLEQTAAMATMMCAEGYAVAGRPAEMRRALATAATLTVSPDVAAAAHSAVAMSALLDRDVARAVGELDAAAQELRRHGSAAPLRSWGLWALLRTVLQERDDEAREELRRSPAVARDVNRGGLSYADAVAAGRTGDAHLAVDLLAAGDVALAAVHWWRRLLRLQVLEAAVRDRWGDPVEELRHDLAGFDAPVPQGGDPRLARACRDVLRRAGAAVPRRGRGDSRVPDALRARGVTSREMDVLMLVALGLTNAQIAERLFLSPRTVETHVASLLGKTGASGRSELAVLLPR